MEKKGYIHIKDERRGQGSHFAPLAKHDGMAAEEVEYLRRLSEELTEDMAAMSSELGYLNKQLEISDKKVQLRALYAEQAENEAGILKLQGDLAQLKTACSEFHFDTDTSRIEEDFSRASSEIDRFNEKQERLGRELSALQKDALAFEQGIAESRDKLKENEAVRAEKEAELNRLSSKNAGLERLEASLSKYKTSANDNTYTSEIAFLSDRLTKNDGAAQELAMRLDKDFDSLGGEASDLVRLLVSKLSLVPELKEKDQRLSSLEKESDDLQSRIGAESTELLRLRTLNLEDKAKVAKLESDLQQLLEAVSKYSGEASEGEEISRRKDAAAAEFISLFVNNKGLEDMIQQVQTKLSEIKEMAGKLS
ncbi:MAG: hypothetical protein HQL10_05540 [Nitrospirae bacterium]|nr:hypothetical protein [Nitrospirota bacterium]